MARFLFEYDRNYAPPAPVMPIEIEGRGANRQRISAVALIDSGADGTLIPHRILKKVGARLWESMNMTGVAGIRQRVDLYLVTIYLGNEQMPIEAVAMPDDSELIIGRDILNQLRVTLDGFSLDTTIETLMDHDDT